MRTLDTHLRALGQPPANSTRWTHVLDALAAAIAVRTEQDNAALAGNTHAFVKSLQAVDRNYRQLAITATIFGATDCIP
jgi:hypothetical protein